MKHISCVVEQTCTLVRWMLNCIHETNSHRNFPLTLQETPLLDEVDFSQNDAAGPLGIGLNVVAGQGEGAVIDKCAEETDANLPNANQIYGAASIAIAVSTTSRPAATNASTIPVQTNSTFVSTDLVTDANSICNHGANAADDQVFDVYATQSPLKITSDWCSQESMEFASHTVHGEVDYESEGADSEDEQFDHGFLTQHFFTQVVAPPTPPLKLPVGSSSSSSVSLSSSSSSSTSTLTTATAKNDSTSSTAISRTAAATVVTSIVSDGEIGADSASSISSHTVATTSKALPSDSANLSASPVPSSSLPTVGSEFPSPAQPTALTDSEDEKKRRESHYVARSLTQSFAHKDDDDLSSEGSLPVVGKASKESAGEGGVGNGKEDVEEEEDIEFTQTQALWTDVIHPLAPGLQSSIRLQPAGTASRSTPRLSPPISPMMVCRARLLGENEYITKLCAFSGLLLIMSTHVNIDTVQRRVS